MPEINSAEEKKLHIRIQQQQGRKFLTIVEGVPEDDRSRIYSILKKKLACGGADKKKEGIIQFMGDHSFIIKDYLNELVPGYEIVMHGKK